MARRRTRGTGEVYQEPSGSWAVRWRENGRRRYKGGFPAKDHAGRLLATIRGRLAQYRAGLPTDPRGLPKLQLEWDRWIERRRATHRDATNDASRWKRHLGPAFGHLRAPEVDSAAIRQFVEDRLAAKLNPATVGACIRLLSTFFSDLLERPRETGATINPVRALPRATRRLYRAEHKPRDTPFLGKMEDVVRVHAKLVEPFSTAFAIGAFGGLRTGEVLGLDWQDIDLEARQIRVHQAVRNSKLGPLKDEDPRIVPVLDALYPVLAAYKLRTGGRGMLFTATQPGRKAGKNGTAARFMRPNALHKALEAAFVDPEMKLDPMTWYQATRHTFASQWVIDGGSMERLALILGHSSTEVTRSYAHLRSEHLGAADRARLSVSLKISQPIASDPKMKAKKKTRKRSTG